MSMLCTARVTELLGPKLSRNYYTLSNVPFDRPRDILVPVSDSKNSLFLDPSDANVHFGLAMMIDSVTLHFCGTLLTDDCEQAYTRRSF